MDIIGIRRSAIDSPNMGDADTAIFETVAHELEQMGHSVVRLSSVAEIHAVAAQGLDRVGAIYTMTRDEDILNAIASDAALDQRLYANSARGIMASSSRTAVDEAMQLCGVPAARSVVLVCAADVETLTLRFPLWMKRCQGHSQVHDDVVLARDHDEARRVYARFAGRDITQVHCSEHVVGDLIKFYGVAGTGFFDCDVADAAHSKFGLEAVNGPARGYPLDAAALHACADRLADRLGLPVYGGDCVVRADGSVCIIDFNDWPSFSRCRTAAATAIAQCIADHIVNNNIK